MRHMCFELQLNQDRRHDRSTLYIYIHLYMYKCTYIHKYMIRNELVRS